MERLESAAARALLSERMKPGAVFTRSFTPGELEAECAAGALYAEPFPGGVLLARRRGEHQILSLALDAGAALPEPAFDRPTVLELAFREKDAALRALQPALLSRGFAPVLRRLRLTRRAAAADAGAGMPLASPAELDAVRVLLETCFDPLTGCLPPDAVLAADVGAGRVLRSGEAVLRFSEGAALEVRQLAVAPRARGQGRGRAILNAFLAAKGDKRCTVWTADTNEAALRLYESAGFAPDGWTSEVLLWRE